MRLILAAALGLAACATTSSPSGNGTMAAGSCEPANANSGAIVYSQPDSTSTPVARLSARTHVCADADAVGFGFRHVKLDDGKDGFLAEGDISG